MREQERNIQSLFDTPEEFRELTRPTAAFVTFEDEDHKTLALNLNKKKKEFMGRPLVFAEASEPTDIIWENRHWTMAERFWREVRAAVIVFILIAASAWFIFKVSTLSSKVARVFPTVDCPTLRTNYGDQLENFAVADYDFIQAHKGMQSSGCLQCFCQQQWKDDPDGYKTNTYGQKDGAKICGEYEIIVLEVMFWTNALSYFIVGINYVLRVVCIMLVDWIGYRTETMRLEKTTTVTFVL